MRTLMLPFCPNAVFEASALIIEGPLFQFRQINSRIIVKHGVLYVTPKKKKSHGVMSRLRAGHCADGMLYSLYPCSSLYPSVRTILINIIMVRLTSMAAFFHSMKNKFNKAVLQFCLTLKAVHIQKRASNNNFLVNKELSVHFIFKRSIKHIYFE